MNGIFATRWLHENMAGEPPAALRRAVVTVSGLTLALIAALVLNKLLHDEYRLAWLLLPLGLAVALVRTHYIEAEVASARLLRLLGALSAFYALIHYPLMPPMDGAVAHGWFALLLVVWVVSLGCGVACYRFPSLGVVPAAFLVWSTHVAGRVTGLRHGQTLDVVPIAEVALCLALAFAVRRLYERVRVRRGWPERIGGIDPGAEFARIGLFVAIAIHLANYFWSAVAKVTLQGPFLAWVWANNPLYIYLAALDGQIAFSGYPALARLIAEGVNRTHILSNLIVLGAQTLAIAGFVMPKRALVLLLILFDGMHVSIAIVAGANFWPWILLNLAIAAVVISPRYARPKPLVGLAMGGFILASPLAADVALLGWYDTGANNNVFFQAEDASGRRAFVSPNFFTFYSYPLGHMDYGMPEPATALNVGSPTGATRRWRVFRAGITCNVPVLLERGRQKQMHEPDFSRFVVNYHRMAQAIERRFGTFPYNAYPHHFFVRPALNADFDRLDKSRIVAYVYRRESVCLSLVDGRPVRRLVSTGEYRIEVPHGR